MAGTNLRLERPLAVLDLESTGVDPRRDRVIEVAVVTLLPDGRESVFHRRINPRIPIPEAATRVHGLTTADVAAAPTFAGIAADLLRALEGADLAGFGLCSFDLPLLVAEFGRAGRRFGVTGRHVLDALAIYRRHEPRDLASAVRFYLGRDHPGAHAALADAWAAAHILDRQVARYGLPTTPAGLHARFVSVDVAGRFRRDAEGRVVFTFGKYAGRRLRDVAERDPGYLRWLRGQDFLDDVHLLLDPAAAGRLVEGD